MSNRDKMIKGMELCGWTKTGSTAKYDIYHVVGNTGKADTRMLVGRRGALRVCRNGAPIASSISLQGKLKQRAFQYLGGLRLKWNTPGGLSPLEVYNAILAGKISI